MRSRVEPYDVTSTDVLRAQQLLSELGYNPGPLDGIPGPRTRAAIESFQQSLGQPVTGQVTPGLLDRLAIERR
jgi:peptidoglycan hydrolase-like protein with peptidoglycan-binding domain